MEFQLPFVYNLWNRTTPCSLIERSKLSFTI